jgi:serine/threonine-protein kinase
MIDDLPPEYEIVEKVAQGFATRVYKVWHKRLDRILALKTIIPGRAPGANARLLEEGRALAAVQHPSHPHIVRLYEVSGDRQIFLVIEFAEGGALASQLDGTPWPARRAVGLIEALARAVQVVHQAGFVLRNVKPAHVLLFEGGVPKLTGLGYARRLDQPDEPGAVVGTPLYMSPEQAQGRTREVGPASDVYALGTILYELLTGRPPFRAGTAVDVLMRVISDQPAPLRAVCPQTPKGLEAVCLKCLEKQPEARYATAEALADALGNCRVG